MKTSALLKIVIGLGSLAGASLSPSGALWAQGNGWSSQASSTPQNLYGVAFSDPGTWVAVGESGMIVRSVDGGIGWATVPSPVADALRGVSFHGKIGLAVGIGGRVLRTVDGGLNWTVQARPTKRALYAVSMGTSLAVITGEEGSIFISTDDGATWKPRGAGTASFLFGVSVYGDLGVGVGGQGAIVNSDNGGAGWGLEVLGGQLTFFYGTSFVTPMTGWAVGTSIERGGLILRSDLSGFTWTLQPSPTNDTLFGVSFTSIDVGTAVGANGTILRTTDGGNVWSIQPSGVTEQLNAVSLESSGLGIAVGNGGTILRTSSTPPRFRRGDANADGTTDISDVISTLNDLFLGTQEVTCQKAADANDDGVWDLSDAVFLLSYSFMGGKAPNEPLANCGTDPTPDELTCERFPVCD